MAVRSPIVLVNGKFSELPIGDTLYVPPSASLNVFNGTDGYYPKWNNNTLTQTSLVYDNGLAIGVGTNTPKSRLTISTASAATAPTNLSASSAYIGLGKDEYATNSFRSIGFGYCPSALNFYPAYFAYQEINLGGNTYGDFVFYTRNVVTDTAPSERMRVDYNGSVGIGATPSIANKFNVQGNTNLAGELSSSATTDAVTLSTARSFYRWIQIYINGVGAKWIQLYN